MRHPSAWKRSRAPRHRSEFPAGNSSVWLLPSLRCPIRMFSTPPAIGRDALIGDPHALWQSAGLPEHVDRNAAARIPVAADAQPFWLDLVGDPLADHHRAVLMERAVIAKARDIEFERFGFQKPSAGDVIDHEMREIRLPRHRTKRG